MFLLFGCRCVPLGSAHDVLTFSSCELGLPLLRAICECRVVCGHTCKPAPSLGASTPESLCLVLCHKQVLAGEEEVWQRGTAPRGRNVGPLDAKPLEARYKILLFPSE